MIATPNFGLFRLDAVRYMRRWLATVTPLLDELPLGRGNLRDQASRAALSAYLNLVEGAGMPKGDGRKGSHYRIAMGSLSEAVACVDAAVLFGLINEEQALPTYELAHAAGRLLGGLVRSASAKRKPSPPHGSSD